MVVTMVTHAEAWNNDSKLQNLPEKSENVRPTYSISWREQIQRQKERPTVLDNLFLLKRYLYSTN